MPSKLILDSRSIEITLNRLAYQLVENHDDFTNTAIIGMQPKGIFVARRILELLKRITGNPDILFGELDITFHRDDFRRKDVPIVPSPMNIDFIVENKQVVLVDDVLFTGRSVRSALDALTDFGRPSKAELLTLIDRRYSRELPIEPDYVGKTVDTRAHDKVKVEWKENAGADNVWLITHD